MLKNLKSTPYLWILIAGDGLAVLSLTLIGFSSHSTLGTSGLRFWVTFSGQWIAWLLIAPLLHLFALEIVADWRQLWRPLWAAALAGPITTFLRSLILGWDISPIFTAVVIATSALAFLIWRALFWLISWRMAWTKKP